MKLLTTMMAMARRGGAATLGCWTLSAAPFASALAFSVVKVPRRFLGSSSKSAIPKVKACGDLSTYDLVCGQEAKLWVGRDHGVARIELDRMQSRNALGHNMLTDLEHCVVKASELSQDHTIRCVVVHSCTESVFCAGKSKRVLDWSGGGEDRRANVALKTFHPSCFFFFKRRGPEGAAGDGRGRGRGLREAPPGVLPRAAEAPRPHHRCRRWRRPRAVVSELALSCDLR